MQSVQFDSAEIESRNEELRRFSDNIKYAVQNLDNELQSLSFGTQKIEDDICHYSATKTDYDGPKGKIEYVLNHMPQRLSAINDKIAKITLIFNRWKNTADGLKREISSKDVKIKERSAELDSVTGKLNALPDPRWEQYTTTDSNGNTRVESVYCDPYESDRKYLSNKRNEIRGELYSLKSERDVLNGKLTVAERNCSMCKSDLDKLNMFKSRCEQILSAAKVDRKNLTKILETLSNIKESIKNYREKLREYNSEITELIYKSDKILSKALDAVSNLQYISRNHIEDYFNKPIKVKFDIDECNKYKLYGSNLISEIGSTTKRLVNFTNDLHDWSDSNRTSADYLISSNFEAFKKIQELFNDEMDFLEKQISIMTDYYNAVD